MVNYRKAIKILEFDKIRQMLCDAAVTEGAKAKALELMPAADVYLVRKKQLFTTDAKRLIDEKGMPPFGDIKDITASLERCEKGASLNTLELIRIAELLCSARRLQEYLDSNKRFDTILDESFYLLTPNKALEDRIRKVIITADMIADDASPELSDIRRKIKNTNNKIKETLSKYTGGSYSKYLQENIVTQRNGRYVVPVKIEYKNEIKGLVHDTSASGATLFIEPMQVVEANNALRELEAAQKYEIEKILAALSGECAKDSYNIRNNYESITELALIFAMGMLSVRMDARSPSVNEDGEFKLIRAKHPLLDPKKAVPINVTVGGKYDTLVVTGPNTGGKTVTLKTLGLFALMVQSGLHVPLYEESTVCVFDKILCDIGDEQSIEQSLSTFSAHMVNIVDIVAKADKKSLVLFDELGSGTDPVEGAALAVSVLEKIREKGALCAATTHYAELKVYALDTDGVCNASCEFDIETLRPTYRLITGTPGKSNAFAISKKLGLPDEIIERARDYISGDNKRFEYVIEKLEATRIEMERERDEARALKAEYENFKRTAEKKMQQRLEESEKQVERAEAKAAAMIASARASSDFIFRELEKVKKQRDSEKLSEGLEAARDRVRRELRKADDKTNPVIERGNSGYKLPRKLKKGDLVHIVNIDRDGIVAEEPKGDGNVSVRIGQMITKTKEKNLMLVGDGAITITTAEKKKVSHGDYSRKVSSGFKPELDLRGMNGEDAWYQVDKYLDDALLSGIRIVTLIHGKGTGKLKAALKPFLQRDKRVATFREGMYGEGDGGVTIVELK
ncbi:MAG: endonuclease MutS2 [Clostridia bacterium]|nr:endonuclease MutS2 [Clostridia bacterium]